MKTAFHNHAIATILLVNISNIMLSTSVTAQNKNGKLVKQEKTFGKFHIGFELLNSEPIGSFNRATSLETSKLGRVIQGGSLNFGMRYNKKWSIHFSPVGISHHWVNSEIFRSAAGPAYSNFTWYGWEGLWKLTQSTFQLNRNFRLFNSNKLNLQVGLIIGGMAMRTTLYNSADDVYQFFFFYSHSNKTIQLKNANSYSMIMGLNTKLNIHISKRWAVNLGIETRLSKLKFSNAVLKYVNKSGSNPEPASFEKKFSYKQNYWVSNFGVGLNYHFDIQNKKGK